MALHEHKKTFTQVLKDSLENMGRAGMSQKAIKKLKKKRMGGEK